MGFWGTFWLMGYGVGKVGSGGKDGAEIDIFEFFDQPGSQINHGVHWDGYEADYKSEAKAVTVPDIYEGWHTCAPNINASLPVRIWVVQNATT